jgi:hypothetical protein
MITVFVNTGEVYTFANSKIAEDWVRDNGDLYEYTTDNLTIMSDVIPENAPLVIEDILHIIMCDNCKTMMKTTTRNEEHILYAICPRCQCRTKI